MEHNMFHTGAVMDYVSNAQVIENDTKSIEEAAVKNQKILNMPRKTRTIVREYEKIGRNAQCPCGSGQKYKNCCLKNGKYENNHELTVLEMAKVKAHQITEYSIKKNAFKEKIESAENTSETKTIKTHARRKKKTSVKE